jgi:hypothetical protein
MSHLRLCCIKPVSCDTCLECRLWLLAVVIPHESKFLQEIILAGALAESRSQDRLYESSLCFVLSVP